MEPGHVARGVFALELVGAGFGQPYGGQPIAQIVLVWFVVVIVRFDIAYRWWRTVGGVK